MRRLNRVVPVVLAAALCTLQCGRAQRETASGTRAGAGNAGRASGGNATGGNQPGSGGTAGTDASPGGRGVTGGSSGTGGAASGGAGAGAGGSAGRAGGPESGGTDASEGGTTAGGAGESAGGFGGTGASAGMSGGATAGGAGVAGAGCAAGLMLPVTPRDADSGWIDRSSNCVGIQGSVEVEADPYGSTITATSLDGHICVAGSTSIVTDSDFDGHFGARITIRLNDPGDGTPDVWDALGRGIKGFGFEIAGTEPPVELRPEVFVNNDPTPYCSRACAPGTQSLTFDTAQGNCAKGQKRGSPAAHANVLTSLVFEIPGVPTRSLDFDFCITGLRALTLTNPLGDPGVCPNSCLYYCIDAHPTLCTCNESCPGGATCCSDALCA